MFKAAKGKVTRQAYVGVPEGTYEDEHGRDGFFGRQSHLYRLHAPTDWTRIEGDLRPYQLNSYNLEPPDMSDPRGGPLKALYNDSVSIAISRRSQAMPFYLRNVQADEIYFVHCGRGRLECDYGRMNYEEGDYIVIPKGTTYRILPESQDNFFLIVESHSEVSCPDYGLIGPHTLFDLGVVETPEPEAVLEAGREWEVRIKHGEEYTSYFYNFCPMDVVGWKGDLAVVKLNVRDIRPLASERIHLPPTVACTLRSDDCVICTFVPRPVERDPEARPLPPYHRNVDWDEVLFFHWSAPGRGIPAGLIDYSPQGVHHGPPPRAIEAAKKDRPARLEVVIVMVETRQRLAVTEEAKKAEIKAT